MKIHLKLLTERYWFRLGLSLCFAITAALSYADRDFIWMGLSLCLLLFSIWCNFHFTVFIPNEFFS